VYVEVEHLGFPSFLWLIVCQRLALTGNCFVLVSRAVITISVAPDFLENIHSPPVLVQMPARLSSMELSPASNPDGEETTRPSRRKSGRAVHAPERLVASSAPKRKRDDIEDVSGEDEDDDADDAPEDEDDEPAEEEVREKTQKTKRAGGVKATAPKRAKTTAGTTKLASRPKTKARTTKKGAKLDSASDVGGLYGMY
jgi:hypothetical protein